ncbi:MAG: hypothetical protein KH396_02705 [Atopobiaceae bacterium]|nr:hypothetical protein [Atopobiaceae bacterium]
MRLSSPERKISSSFVVTCTATTLSLRSASVRMSLSDMTATTWRDCM